MFYEARLSPAISRGAQGGPEFQTKIVTTGAGVEYRESRWSEIRSSWNVGYGVKTADEWAEIYSFFVLMRGKNFGFRFRDQMDHHAEQNFFAYGDGTSTIFDLYKSYEIDDLNSQTYRLFRRITKPAPDYPFAVYKNGVLLTETTDYTVDYTRGRISFSSAPAGGATASRTLTFSGNPANNDTVTIGDRIYIFKTTLTGMLDEVFIDTSTSQTIDNLVATIKADLAYLNHAFSPGQPSHTKVTATKLSASTMSVTALEKGTAGNAINISESSAVLSWPSSYLVGGIDGDELSWTGDFDVPARFDVDKLEASLPEYNFYDWPDVPIIELHPDEVV